MPPRQRVPIGQDILPGMPPTPSRPINPRARNAIATLLLPEFVGLRPEDYTDVTDDQLRLADTDKLKASLIDVSRETHGAIGYFNPITRRPVFIASTPHEFGILTGSVHVLGARAVSKTEERRTRLGGAYPKDADAARRSGIHAVENRATVVQKYINNELLPEMNLIDKFLEAAENPGFKRIGDQANLRLQFASLQTGAIGNILDALHRSRRWSPEQHKRASRAIEARMFLDRNDNRHIGYFKSLLTLAKDRDGYLLAIARERVRQSETYARKNTPDATNI